MFFSAYFRTILVAACLLTGLLMTGCARPAIAPRANDAQSDFWTGRINLQVQSEPAQSFSAGFELKGKPAHGELTLSSPLGNVLSVLRWSPSEVVLNSGRDKIQRFDSVDTLMIQATGSAVPLNGLFAWLQGDQTHVSGWIADLSRHNEGRISAKRTEPQPEVNLKIVLDQ